VSAATPTSDLTTAPAPAQAHMDAAPNPIITMAPSPPIITTTTTTTTTTNHNSKDDSSTSINKLHTATTAAIATTAIRNKNNNNNNLAEDPVLLTDSNQLYIYSYKRNDCCDCWYYKQSK